MTSRLIFMLGLAGVAAARIAATGQASPATVVELRSVDLRSESWQPSPSASPVAPMGASHPLWRVTTGTELRRVDAGVEDVGALSVSLRHLETGLAEPRGFEHVYRVPGRSDLLMRASGALHAVFPLSSYVEYRGRLISVIPPSTVFYIGDGEQAAASAGGRRPAAAGGDPAPRSSPAWTPIHSGETVLAMDERRLAEIRLLREPEEGAAPAAMCSDADYRARRVGELMRRAADAEVERQGQRGDGAGR